MLVFNFKKAIKLKYMNFRKITFLAALVTVFNFYSCKDDEEVVTIEERDETEVYNEDILEIEEFLSTHTYNYQDFDFDNCLSHSSGNRLSFSLLQV